ncbi:MAG: hydroxymethylbilane synthase [Chitinispirillaceae bacterium]|nr:hydroxymethylbilane synthase [Chitinispirillaceae bacterium]
MQREKIVIGTRGSKLARAQTEIVVNLIKKAYPSLSIEVKIIVTKGDKEQNIPLSVIGGKGIFIKELEYALLDKTIDMAVHSFKDITSSLPSSLQLAAFLKPESVCDVLVCREGICFETLPKGAKIGTGSSRRKVQLLRLRPDLEIVNIRGNVDTRIAKVDKGEYDGIMLSEAGIIRLGLSHRISTRFEPTKFYPAPGQGVIAIEIRKDDNDISEICNMIGDKEQFIISTAELSFLNTIGFDCHTPLGIYSVKNGKMLNMKGFFVDRENRFIEVALEESILDPIIVGKKLAEKILQKGRN